MTHNSDISLLKSDQSSMTTCFQSGGYSLPEAANKYTGSLIKFEFEINNKGLVFNLSLSQALGSLYQLPDNSTGGGVGPF